MIKITGFLGVANLSSEGIFLNSISISTGRRRWKEIGESSDLGLPGAVSVSVNRDLGGCSFCKEEVVKSSYPTVGKQ
jgi:hypothetical protein